MPDLFGRVAVVQVEGRDVSALRIAFEVERSHRGEDNSAEIRIWNASTDTRATIARSTLRTGPTSGRGARCVLLAGYGTEAHLLFAGRLRRVETRREGADVITVLSSSDGIPPSARVARGHAAGAELAAVVGQLLDAAQAAGLGVGAARRALPGLRGRPVGGAGLALSGPLSGALDAALGRAGLEWSVQDEQLVVTAAGAAAPGRATELSADSGLVESPELGERGAVRARALIVPGVAPPALVSLRSEIASGFYRVETARYSGDTEGADWYVELGLRPARR